MLPAQAPLLLAATFVLALGLGLYLTPIVRRGALRFNVLDHPDGALKRHTEAVPYLGGIAVYVAFLVTLALVFDFSHQVTGLLLGGTMMAMLGLFDDMRVLPVGPKLLGQALATWVAIKSGVVVELVAVPQWAVVPVSAAWLLFVTNAVNILDVSDGLASATSAVSALALAFITARSGDVVVATTSLALAGALLGFLHFNRPPARIYLGDTGSLFVGFMLGALTLIGEYTTVSPYGAVAPLLILAVPLTEVSLVVLARLAQGRPPWLGSPDHFAMRLRARGWSAWRVLWTSVAAAATGCTAGLAAALLPRAAMGIGMAGAVVTATVLVLLLRLGRAPRISE